MNQQNQGTSSLPSPDPPQKRKRGRPRKDENLVHAASATAMPASESLKKNKQSVGTSDDIENEMVGQVVTGVIEGSFDAGYLLNVRVGDTDTQLRGVVFLKEKITPVTPANDIAPHIKMCKRKDIPIPVINPKSHLHSTARPSELSTRQPVEIKFQAPTVPAQTQSSVPQFPRTGSLDTNSFSVQVNNLSAGSSLGEKVMSQQFSEPGTDSQSAPEMAQSELNNVDEQDKESEEVEAATIVEGPNGVEANNASKTETVSEPIADVPGIELVCKDTEVQTQAVDPEKSALVADEVKSLNPELNKTPVFAQPAAIAVIPSTETVGKDPQIQPQDVDVEKRALVRDDDSQIQPQAVDSAKSALVPENARSLNLKLNQTPLFAEPAPVAGMPGTETVCKDSQIQPQDVDPEKIALVDDVVKSMDIELNQTPILAEPGRAHLASKPVDNVMDEQAYSAPELNQTPVFAEPTPVAVIPGTETVCKDSQIQPQDVGSEKNALVDDVIKSMDIELNQIPSFAEPGHASSDLASKPVDNLMEEEAYSLPNPTQMFGGDTVPSESKLAFEGSIPSGTVEPHISSPSAAITNVDCDVEDVIPPAQS